MDNRKSNKCGVLFRRQVLLAMLADFAGATVSPRPHVCPADGGEHEWEEAAPTEAVTTD